MNLIEKYLSSPKNYIVEAGGGYGKSTSLKYLARKLTGQKVNGKTEQVIYIPMSYFNLEVSCPGIILKYLKRYFSNEVTDQALFEMFQKNETTIHYLFLLDGLNEIHNYEINGQTVLNLIYNDILRLMKYENVNFIISMRRAEMLPEQFKNSFEVLVLKVLSKETISRYLGIKNLTEIPEHIWKMLENPMLLTIFKQLYETFPEQAVKIDNKYGLFELYFGKEMSIHEQQCCFDHLDTVRRYVIEKIIPIIAFYVEYGLLDNTTNTEYVLDKLVNQACEMNTLPENMNYRLVLDMISNMGLIDQNMQFKHELIRDYFATKGLKLVGNSGRYAEVKEFLEKLTKWLEYRNNKKELVRRTRFLDLADFVFSSVKSELVQELLSFGMQPKEKALCLAEGFYQQLAGVYDDLSNGREAAHIGWIALENLRQIESYIPPMEAADRFSFLYYIVKWDRNEDEKCYSIILHAKEILDGVSEEHKSRDYYELYGKILSNVGSYFYKLGTENKLKMNYKIAEDMFLEAEKWHNKAFVYRKNIVKRDCR